MLKHFNSSLSSFGFVNYAARGPEHHISCCLCYGQKLTAVSVENLAQSRLAYESIPVNVVFAIVRREMAQVVQVTQPTQSHSFQPDIKLETLKTNRFALFLRKLFFVSLRFIYERMKWKENTLTSHLIFSL